MPRLANTIEAILYLKAQALSLSEIAECANVDRATAEEGLLELMADYAHRETALEVVEINGDYSLQLREDFQTLVQTMIPADIGKGALRTLAVVALKGPIIQTELINLRGSTAYQHVQELVEQGFIRKRRRSDGRSYWLQVTDKFHQYFQLNQLPGNLDQLLGQSNSSVSKAQGHKSSTTETGSIPEADLNETDLSETDLSETDLSEADEVITDVAPIVITAVISATDLDSDAELEVMGTISDAILEAEEAAFQAEPSAQEFLSA